MPGLENALELARLGFRVFPLHGIKGGACTCGRSKCSSPGKHPIAGGWQQAATTDEGKLAQLFNRRPSANVGIATGQGLVVIDLDGAQGLATLARWERKHGPLPATRRVRTGGGGLHLYFRVDADLPNSVRKLGPGVDVRGTGGYVVAPGSVHASGGSYEWEDNAS